MPTTQETPTASPIGRRTPRVDGPLKVSGQAQYTSDFHFPGMLYAVPVEATIANGRVVKLDTAAAEKMPGVRAIFHRENIGKIFRSVLGAGIRRHRRRAAPAVRRRRHSLLRPVRRARRGRHVRDRQGRGRRRARHVRQGEAERRHRPQSGRRTRSDATTFGPKPACKASAATPRPLSRARRSSSTRPTSRRPRRTIRIELHATTAIWDGSKLTLYESSQGVVNLQGVLAQMFGLPKENVRVITKFVGSGFGSKLFPWTHCPLAAAAARQLGKPVKLVVSRKMMFQTVGHRPRTQQRVRLGATPDGKLVSLQHDYVYHRVDARRLPRRLRRSDGVPVQRAEPARDVRPRQAQHRLADRHARPRRRARALRDRVGDERTGRSAQDRSGQVPHPQRTEDRRVAGHSVLVAPFARVLRTRRGEVRLVEAHARRSAR